MKTIEERAKEYADRHKATEIKYFEVSRVYGYSRIYNAEITAYERGAKEQKDIDDAKWLKLKSAWEKEAQINHDDEANYKQGYHDAIEKAYKLINNYIADLAYPVSWADAKLLISIPERLRKAMEE